MVYKLMNGIDVSRDTPIKNSIYKHNATSIINKVINDCLVTTGLDRGKLFTPSRKKETIECRQFIYFILRYRFFLGPKTQADLLKKLFDFNIDHSTIIHGYNHLFDQIETESRTNNLYRRIDYHIGFVLNFTDNPQKLLPKKCPLHHIDRVEIGKRKITILNEYDEVLRLKKSSINREKSLKKSINFIESYPFTYLETIK